MNRCLIEANSMFIKYNVLIGIETLGVSDFNKYFVSFQLLSQNIINNHRKCAFKLI